MRAQLLIGVIVLFFILCLGVYFAFGPGSESATAIHYPGDSVSGKPITTPTGLIYYDLKVGTGETPADPTTRVRVHYTGWLMNGTKFDSSLDSGRPAEFPLNGVIKGWTEGVGTMKTGGKRKLIIPPDLGYGPAGSPPNIPPTATLVFDVELLSIVK